MKKADKKVWMPIFLSFTAVLLTAVFVFNRPMDLSKSEAFLIKNSILERTGKILSQISRTAREASASEEKFIKPEIVKGVYLTGWSASLESKIDYVYDLAESAGVNTVVIDIKDYSGYVSYDVDDYTAPKVKEYGAEKIKIYDIDNLIRNFHDRGIYTIARIAVFQDPVLVHAREDLAVYNKYHQTSQKWDLSFLLSNISVWLDNMKLAWIDPASEESWDYNISIAKDALNRGFDEINFDYVRFPSDGDLSNMGFPKWDGTTPKHLVIRSFFQKVRESLPDAVLSIDLFGLSTVNYDDLGIGQVIEDAYEYFDYVCPMVYPSHYANGFMGYGSPAEHPYEVVKYSIDKGLLRLKAFNELDNKRDVYLRPWLQDFNLGAVYNMDMVKAQIQATKDSLGNDYKGFMLWNSSNIYTGSAVF
ncbi:MAG: hypothetical protein NTW46_02155 [Candidatus Nealsonbacteria bacterium]|nr:hypothetical protein [Candidatus Nealsonbacteria bacterium]